MQQKTKLRQMRKTIENLQHEVNRLREQVQSSFPVEEGVVMSEVKEIYKGLKNERDSLGQQIIAAIDANDYVQFTKLKQERNNIQDAIDALDQSYGEMINHATIRDGISHFLNKSASTTRGQGDKIVNHFHHGVTNVNDFCHQTVMNASRITNKCLNRSIQWNNKFSRFLIQKTANSLDKLSDKLKK